MKILPNNLLQTLCNLLVMRVTKKGEFYNKYLDWGYDNKCGEVPLENIGSACSSWYSLSSNIVIKHVQKKKNPGFY